MPPLKLRSLIISLCALSSWSLLASAGLVQKHGLSQSATAKERANTIKTSFLGAWKDYLQYGYPDDEVLPTSKGRQNTRNGWGATLVDALSTLWVMDYQVEFADAVNKTVNIDFNRSYVESQTVSVFETTIRYLGGMLSAYELSGSKNSALLSRAVQLGDKLSYAWSGDSQALPWGFLDFSSDTPIHDTSNIAEAGTLIIEFDRLSKFSGNDKYRALAAKAEHQLITGPQVFPGLPAQQIDPGSNQPVGDYVSWGGGSDSYMEYLLKYALLIENKEPAYIKAWQNAVNSSVEHLLTYSSVKNLTYLADYSASRGGKQYVFSHLACFLGGNWLLGAKVLGSDELYKYGVQLVDTCLNSYNGTATGIGPEAFGFVGSDGNFTGNAPSAADLAFYQEHGFFVTNAQYILRPEVLESNFYAWRITGDERYQEFAWQAFQALLTYSKAPASFASLDDVNSTTDTRRNDCESFFYAETFKYLYLTFADPDLINLDEYVFNTEAHPFRYTAVKQPLRKRRADHARTAGKYKHGHQREGRRVMFGRGEA